MYISNVSFINRDIATAIKELLDSVNEVLKTYQAQGKMREYRKVCCYVTVSAKSCTCLFNMLGRKSIDIISLSHVSIRFCNV